MSKAIAEPRKEVGTSMPITGNLMDTWDKILKDYDELVYIPMSSGLSSSCATAKEPQPGDDALFEE